MQGAKYSSADWGNQWVDLLGALILFAQSLLNCRGRRVYEAQHPPNFSSASSYKEDGPTGCRDKV